MEVETLLQDVGYSTFRWLIGLFLGAVIAVFCHAISTLFRPAIRVFGFLADFLRAIPIIALVPTFIVLFGASETGKFVMIAWASGLPIYVHLCRAAAISAEQKLVFAAARMTRRQTLFWLKLPALLVASVEAMRKRSRSMAGSPERKAVGPVRASSGLSRVTVDWSRRADRSWTRTPVAGGSSGSVDSA